MPVVSDTTGKRDTTKGQDMSESRTGQATRYRVILGYAQRVTGERLPLAFPCAWCGEDMTWDALKTAQTAGACLAHDVAREGEGGVWTWDVVHPACSDCNGDALTQDMLRTDLPAPYASILATDYRASTQDVRDLLALVRGMTDARKARKRAARAAAGRTF